MDPPTGKIKELPGTDFEVSLSNSGMRRLPPLPTASTASHFTDIIPPFLPVLTASNLITNPEDTYSEATQTRSGANARQLPPLPTQAPIAVIPTPSFIANDVSDFADRTPASCPTLGRAHILEEEPVLPNIKFEYVNRMDDHKRDILGFDDEDDFSFELLPTPPPRQPPKLSSQTNPVPKMISEPEEVEHQPITPSLEDANVLRTATEGPVPGSILNCPVMLSSLRWPHYLLCESERDVQALLAHNMEAVQGAYWKITQITDNRSPRGSTPSYLISLVLSPNTFLEAKLNFVVPGNNKNSPEARWKITPLECGCYTLAPEMYPKNYLFISSVQSKSAKLYKGSVTLDNAFFILPVASIGRLDFHSIPLVDTAGQTSISTPTRINPCWMSKLKDNLYLTEIYFPGTHDAGSFKGHSISLVNTLAKTQSYSIDHQLEIGIRFMDIRLRHAKDHLYVHHGSVYCDDDWPGVLQKCLLFLQTYPSEFIVIKVQQEYKTESNTTTTWGSLVLQQLMRYVPEENRWTQNTIPTVQQARGKIVLTTWSNLLNLNYPSLGLIPWGGLTKEDELYYIQDEYDSPTVTWKWEVFVLLWLRAAKHPRNSKYFFANHASATNPKFLSGPMKYALSTHKRMLPMLMFGPRAPQIFLLDFPSIDLIEAIIQRNVRENQ